MLLVFAIPPRRVPTTVEDGELANYRGSGLPARRGKRSRVSPNGQLSREGTHTIAYQPGEVKSQIRKYLSDDEMLALRKSQQPKVTCACGCRRL